MKKKGKDPAILFYPADWVTGTMGMSFEEKGAYMELLMMQFSRGHMGGHMIGQVVGQIWDKISHKFVQDDQGLWYNERMDMEKERRKSFIESRKNNLKGKNQHSKKGGHMDGHLTSHMENENINVNKDIIKGKGKSLRKPLGKEWDDEAELINFVISECPRVMKMKEPLTPEQCSKLIKDYPLDALKETLEAMENHQPLQKKYISANRTLRGWLKRRNLSPGKTGEKIGRNTKEQLQKTMDDDF